MKNQPVISSSSPSIQIVTQLQIISSGTNLTRINSTLMDKDNLQLQGILRAQVNGQWGVICDNQFDLVTARIVCTQLGLVAHPMVCFCFYILLPSTLFSWNNKTIFRIGKLANQKS